MPKPRANQIERNIAQDKLIKDIKNLFKPKKKKGNGIDNTKYKGLRDIRYLYETKEIKDNGIKDEVLSDIRTLFEPEEDYYKPVKIGNAFGKNVFAYESNGDKDKTLLTEE